LVFGHGRREEHTASIDRAGAHDFVVIDETPADIINRFFLEAVRPAIGRRTQSLTVWSDYKAWCGDRGIASVPHAKFGKLTRWRKERIGRTVWYLDAELAEGYAGLAPLCGPKALPASGAVVVKGTPTAQ
jgi:hypothetical protein